MLSYGSRGDPVLRLQGALNLDPNRDRTLQPDGIFGGQTLGRVKHFQMLNKTPADGLVGPITLGLLKPFLDLFDTGGGGTGGPDPQEAIKRQAIIQSAAAACAVMGWNNPVAAPPEGAQNIALRFLAQEDQGRARQGGPALSAIMKMGGAGAGAEQAALEVAAGCARFRRKKDECSEADYSKKRKEGIDMFSWCGVFALSIFRTVGVNVPGWTNGNIQKNPGFRLIAPADVQPGDVGIASPAGRNHHFIVIARNGPELLSIDGNAGLFHSIVQGKYGLQRPNSPHAAESPIQTRRGVEQGVFLSAF